VRNPVRHPFHASLGVAAALAFGFLLLPILALFLNTTPAQLWEAWSTPEARDALVVSVKTSALAHIFILVVGTPVAYLLATRRFPGRPVAIAMVELPLVLPPAVAGIGLLAAFGRTGLLGTSLPVTQAAVVFAVIFVASPFYMRQGIAAFESIDREVMDAARTLGAGPWRTFWRVAVPLAARGLGAGSALAFARGLGEFGATIMFAGSLQGVTQTLPLAIYAQLGVDREVAIAIGALLVIVSAALLVAVKLLSLWEPLRLISTFRSAPSPSR
jgi:molybdate transport system permease protein